MENYCFVNEKVEAMFWGVKPVPSYIDASDVKIGGARAEFSLFEAFCCGIVACIGTVYFSLPCSVLTIYFQFLVSKNCVVSN